MSWRSYPFIYTGGGSTGKFKFDFGWRLRVAAILFCTEFVYYYILYIITTWVVLDSNRPMTHVPLHIFHIWRQKYKKSWRQSNRWLFSTLLAANSSLSYYTVREQQKLTETIFTILEKESKTSWCILKRLRRNLRDLNSKWILSNIVVLVDHVSSHVSDLHGSRESPICLAIDRNEVRS